LLKLETSKLHRVVQLAAREPHPAKATGNSRFENAKFPPPKKKFPFGKMLDFARSNTIGTQTSNIYLNQLQ